MATYGGVDESVFEKRIKAVLPLVRTYLSNFKHWGLNGYAAWEKSSDPGPLLALPASQQIDVLLLTASELSHFGLGIKEFYGLSVGMDYLRKRILEQDLPLAYSDLVYLAHGMIRTGYAWEGPDLLLSQFFLKLHEQGRLNEDIRSILKKIIPGINYNDSKARRNVVMLQQIVNGRTQLPIQGGEAWATQVLVEFPKLTPMHQQAWIELIYHCQTASSNKPSNKWLATARKLIDKLGDSDFEASICRWFPLVDEPRIDAVDGPYHIRQCANDISRLHADILKGLAWCASLLESDDVARALSNLCVSAYRKVPGSGPRLMALGNACIWSLGAMPTQSAVGRLAWLKVKLKMTSAQKTIDKALTAAADRLGLPRDEIEELAVPAYGMEDVGLRSETLGDVAAELRITGTHHTELRFIKPDGITVKSPPKHIAESFTEELKEFKVAARDIQKMIPAQRDRLDALYMQNKAWPLPIWRERYLDHPLVGTLARRLIWQFTQGDRSISAIWHDGKLVTADDQPVAPLDNDTRVTLWHPIAQPVEDILAWRDWLMRHEVQQPFKQAHREVYLLTDAERNTEVYSNRYAAHLLKQHQFNALCTTRGWRNRLRLLVDDNYTPATRLLPAWNLRVEYWIEGVGRDYGTDTLASGAFLYLSTDQVRFYTITAPENHAHAMVQGYQLTDAPPLPLRDIPPLVFSECMRDVDLFVGVASVGNDPAWQDAGTNQQHRDYWHQYSFGELTTSATTRKELLQTLIPRLKIARRCSFDEKYLIVQGQLRTYKIHLGSGNILMAPNDQYLCIVPKPAGTAVAENKVFLPFEGDRTLSVILSKALMLAADDKITDTSILTQIKPSA